MTDKLKRNETAFDKNDEGVNVDNFVEIGDFSSIFGTL